MRGVWIFLNALAPSWVIVENGFRSLLEVDDFRLCRRGRISFFKGRTQVPNTLIALACFRVGYWMTLHLRAEDISDASGFSPSVWQFVLDSFYSGMVIVITAFSHSQARFSAWLILQGLLFLVSCSLALGFALAGWHGWWSWLLQPVVHCVCCSACACRKRVPRAMSSSTQAMKKYHLRSRVRLRLCVLTIDSIYVARSVLESTHEPRSLGFLVLEFLLTGTLLFPHFQGEPPSTPKPFVALQEEQDE